MVTPYLIAWVVMVPIAILNGVLRESTYGRRLSELRAHQLSTVAGIVLLGAFMWAVIRAWPPWSGGQVLEVGLLWVLLTVAFEFSFGRFVVKRSWTELIRDYDLLKGRMWLLVLVWVAVAPYLFYRLR